MGENAIALSSSDGSDYYCHSESMVSGHTGTNSVLRQSTERVLDLETLDAASKQEGLTAPRCKTGASLQAEEQPTIRCLLARLAWETCAVKWGYTSWNSSRKSVSANAKARMASIHTDSAMLHAHLGDVSAAAESYKASLRLMPSQGSVHYKLGVLLLQNMSLLEPAAEHFKEAIRLDAEADDHMAHVELLQTSLARADRGLSGGHNKYISL